MFPTFLTFLFTLPKSFLSTAIIIPSLSHHKWAFTLKQPSAARFSL